MTPRGSEWLNPPNLRLLLLAQWRSSLLAYNALLKYPIYFAYPVRFSELIEKIREFIIPKKTPKNISGKVPYRYPVCREVKIGQKATTGVVSAWKATVRLLNVPRHTVSDAICRIKNLGNDGRRPGSGRKRTVNTSGIFRRWRQLLRRAASQRWDRFLFADEKLFTVRQVHNSQNDRIWCVDALSTPAIVEHSQHPKSVMVWGGIYASGETL
ncbi:paired domain-containing protein [Trichonephila clavipes]|nr:paired domain-containing protein [Trichonephila clavipes]